MRRAAFHVLITIAAAVMATSIAVPLDAQGLGDRLKRRAEEAAKRKAEERAEKRAGEAADKALDRAECAASDKLCQERAAQAAQQGSGQADGAVDAGTAPAPSTKPGEGAWANYDFVPGTTPLYVDDFRRDVVGDFPRRMEFQSGQLEIVEWNSGRWLRASEDSRFFLQSAAVLPTRYTLEFDYSMNGEVWISFGPDEQTKVVFTGDGGAQLSNSAKRISANGRYDASRTPNKVRRARMLVDGNYVKVYLDDRRILNVPNAELPRTNKILFYTDGEQARPTLFGNFSLMAGGRKLYDAIAETGRVATQGIYFATGSDVIRPESSPTLKEIATMLTEHPELTITIEGHTDNVGAAAANQTLSEKRAAAVKAVLVSSYGVPEDRLATKGLGASKPAAPNTTDEGRQQNRRVELVKM